MYFHCKIDLFFVIHSKNNFLKITYLNAIIDLEYTNMNKTQSLSQGSSSLVNGGRHAGKYFKLHWESGLVGMACSEAWEWAQMDEAEGGRQSCSTHCIGKHQTGSRPRQSAKEWSLCVRTWLASGPWIEFRVLKVKVEKLSSKKEIQLF